MRTNARVDANQKQIVTALRRAGATVQSLASIGKGCPDLLVGIAGRNYLLEVKDGSKPQSQLHLTKLEEKWLFGWMGSWDVVYDIQDALVACGLT